MDTVVQKQPIPWARRKELGLLKALYQTIQQVLFRPGEFFKNLEVEGPYLGPFNFYIIVSIFVIIIGIVYEILFNKGRNVPQLLVLLVLSPLFIFFVAALVHLGVLLFRGKGGFKGTFNVLAYATATNIFNIIPFIGALISLIWGVIVVVIGFKRVHKFSIVKSFLSYFYFLFAVILLAVIALLGAIAIPNILRAKMAANEAAVQETVKMISSTIETYAAKNNGRYPSNEFDLSYSISPPVGKIYNRKEIKGYFYSVNFNPNGYAITATPSSCLVTGSKIITIETAGKLSEKDCNKQILRN